MTNKKARPTDSTFALIRTESNFLKNMHHLN